MKYNNLVGKEVKLKTGWYKGEWGIIKGIIGDEFHVAIYNDEDQCLVFNRDEFTVKRK